jgi:hypothetical protein
MESVEQVEKAHVIKVLIDAAVVVDPPSYIGWQRTLEDRIRALEVWTKEFQEFIRDHRSQDPVYLSVERKFQDQCSICHSEYEAMTDEEMPGKLYCANCGTEIES